MALLANLDVLVSSKNDKVFPSIVFTCNAGLAIDYKVYLAA